MRAQNEEKNTAVEKSEMELKYEAYLVSEDKERLIDGEMYYRAVEVEFFNMSWGPSVFLCLPNKMFRGKRGNRIRDEYGRCFDLEGPSYYSFGGAIPEWYFNCMEFWIKGLMDTESIGRYFCVVDKGDLVRDNYEANEIVSISQDGIELPDVTIDFEKNVDSFSYTSERNVGHGNYVGIRNPLDNPAYMQFRIYNKEYTILFSSRDQFYEKLEEIRKHGYDLFDLS